MQEKKLRKRKEAPIEQIENFLFEQYEKVESFPDDYIQSEFTSFIRDMCTEYDICPVCFTKRSEGMYEDRIETHCNCDSSPKIIPYKTA